MFDELETTALQIDNNRRDDIIPAKEIKVLDHKNVSIGNNSSKMSEWTLDGLCDLSGVPMNYMKKCIKTGKDDLVSYNINKWLKDDGRKFLVRTYNGVVEGITSEKYVPFSHLEAIQSIKEKFIDSEYEIKTSSISSYCMHLRMILPKLKKDFLLDDPFTPGFDIVNSEVGKYPFMINPKIYRMICTNGMVVEEKGINFYRFRHVHLSVVNPKILNEYVDNTLKAIPAVMDTVEEMYIGSTKTILEKNDVNRIFIEMKSKHSTKKVVKPIFEDWAVNDSLKLNFNDDVDVMDSGTPTLSGFWNSATSCSQKIQVDIEEQNAIEITASQILFRIMTNKRR